MNWAHITGNLTSDPETRTVTGKNGENTVCNFSVAVNRYRGGEKLCDFFRVTLWNRMAENAAKYLRKGRKVAVSGCVTARAWISRDGEARCQMEIVDVKEIEYLGGGQRAEDDYQPPMETPPEGAGDGFTQLDADDDLPF